MTDEQLYQRANRLFDDEDSWSVVKHVLQTLDDTALDNLRCNPKNEYAAFILSANKLLRESFITLSRAAEDQSYPDEAPDDNVDEECDYTLTPQVDAIPEPSTREYREIF